MILDRWGPDLARRMSVAHTILQGSGAAILIVGPRGRGKTLAATWLAWMTWRAHRLQARTGEPSRRMMYASWPELAEAERATWRGSREGVSSPLELARNADLLVLDELHEQRDANLEGGWFQGLLDSRYRSLQRTILVSCWEASALANVMPASALDRIAETGVVLTLDGPSMRVEEPRG